MSVKNYLRKMKAPRDVRPSIMRKGILQIHITRACDKACYHCTQGSNLGGKPVMMSLEEFEQSCYSLKGYFGVVGIFGGNPALHPKFEEICKIFCKYFPYDQRGLWCNHPRGKGKIMRKVFNPHHSNLNVHLDQEAYDEFYRDWPESRKRLKGLERDSRHSPPFVAMRDVKELPHWNRREREAGVKVENNEENRWKLISECDINQLWSAMICSVPGKGLRGFFCEIAGAMAMLHANDPKWPDLGVEVVPGWWKKGMEAFGDQVKFYCHRCGIPLRLEGELAVLGEGPEQVSETHSDIYKTKDKNRLVQITKRFKGRTLDKMTNYIENGEDIDEN